MNEEELKKPKAKARPLDDLLSLRSKPFADWKEERLYLRDKWGVQGRRVDLSADDSSESSSEDAKEDDPK